MNEFFIIPLSKKRKKKIELYYKYLCCKKFKIFHVH